IATAQSSVTSWRPRRMARIRIGPRWQCREGRLPSSGKETSMKRHKSCILILSLVGLSLQGCQDQPALTESRPGGALAASVASPESSGRHIVVFSSERVPADFGARVAQLGGSIENALDSIGVATVTGLSEAAAAELSAAADVRAVESDAITAPQGGEVAEDPPEQVANDIVAAADAIASPTAAQFYPRQWNLRAVFAPEAWAAGHLGSRDVVVAILDTGIDYTLPDFAGLVDVGRSKSFTPEEDPVVAERYPGRLPISDLRDHGTAAASVIASKGTVLAGVNQDATLSA